jgi:uncharacterized membrane protein YdbT with pleckstrin-like domain
MQATAAVDAAGVPLFAVAILEPGEIIIGMWRPTAWYVPLRSARIVIGVALAAVATAGAAGSASLEWTTPIVQVAAALIVARVAWVMADWASRVYVLTDRRVMRRRGIVSPTIYQVPLQRLKRVDLAQSAPARLVGTGTVNFSQQSQGGYDAAWVLAPRAAELRQLVLDTRQRYRR